MKGVKRGRGGEKGQKRGCWGGNGERVNRGPAGGG